MLLAFDTSTPRVSVAVHDGAPDSLPLVEHRSIRPMEHAEQLAPLIERSLADAGASRQDLTAIAVGVGPGPFTGLRVGLVTARTLGFVLGIPVRGACSLDVLAVEAVEAVENGIVPRGEFVVATDARRKEVYAARYDAAGVRLTGPLVDRPAALATADPVAGEGAVLYPEAFPNRCGPTAPSAGWLARAVAAGRVGRYDAEPLYLRRPDAVAAHPPKRVS